MSLVLNLLSQQMKPQSASPSRPQIMSLFSSSLFASPPSIHTSLLSPECLVLCSTLALGLHHPHNSLLAGLLPPNLLPPASHGHSWSWHMRGHRPSYSYDVGVEKSLELALWTLKWSQERVLGVGERFLTCSWKWLDGCPPLVSWLTDVTVYINWR